MSIKFKIGMASCGLSAGAEPIYEKLLILSKEYDFTVEKTGCLGFCYAEVLVEVIYNNKSFFYQNVDENIAVNLVKYYVLNQQTEIDKNRFDIFEKENFAFQKRIVLRNCGIINPEFIDDYLNKRGYNALKKVLTEMSKTDVLNEIKNSGLRGRGGAGFLTGLKWELASKNSSEKKYVICNGDEGDPGAFMDRAVLESDPHSVIEGMIICGYAIDADEGYLYVRAEYPLAIKRLKIALAQAKEKKLLGRNILGTSFSFDIKIKEGAGAFVCGEETALIQSIEGQRGMPRFRPPYPAEKGLFGKPTNINNVETFANIAWIIEQGSAKFAELGTEKSKGTKVFALAGKIKNAGLIEVPMGTRLKEIIFKIGGGIKQNKKFKAVQLGGPSGGCIPENLIDTVVDYESLMQTGAIMGSGGMVVMDEDTCMVDVARYFLNFIKDESCGKCTYCRIGTKRLLEILTGICNGNGTIDDIKKMEDLSINIKLSSLCGLGQTAPNPVLTTLRYFKDEYIEHIKEKKCRAKVCRSLITYIINDETCIKCGICQKNCPVNAIDGRVKEYFKIIQTNCIKCGKCRTVCPVKAVEIHAGKK